MLFVLSFLFFLQAPAPQPIKIVESPVHSENIFLLSHSPTPAGVACTMGTGPDATALKVGVDYLWMGNNTLRPITLVNGKATQGTWPDGAVSCAYEYMPGH